VDDGLTSPFLASTLVSVAGAAVSAIAGVSTTGAGAATSLDISLVRIYENTSLRLLGSNDLGLGFHSRNSRSLSIGSDRGRNSSIGSKGCAGHLGSRGRFGGSGSLDGGG